MGKPYGGPLRVRGQQPVRTILLLELVPRVGGLRRFRLRLERLDNVNQLPLSDDREGLAEYTSRGCRGDINCPILGVRHVVHGDLWRPIRCTSLTKWWIDPDLFVPGSVPGGWGVVPLEWPR
jgi:hypothetical protein